MDQRFTCSIRHRYLCCILFSSGHFLSVSYASVCWHNSSLNFLPFLPNRYSPRVLFPYLHRGVARRIFKSQSTLWSRKGIWGLSPPPTCVQGRARVEGRGGGGVVKYPTKCHIFNLVEMKVLKLSFFTIPNLYFSLRWLRPCCLLYAFVITSLL